MNILYIPRHPHRYSRNRGRGFLSALKNRLLQNGIEGFFEGSLNQAGTVTRIPYHHFIKHQHQYARTHDVVVINFRAHPQPGYYPFENDLADTGLVKVLFVGNDIADVLPPERTIEAFDLIFKREPYKDKKAYPLAEHNRAKIHPTMLACPLVYTHPLTKTLQFPKQKTLPKQHDVFFSGTISKENMIRPYVWQKLQASNIACHGGLQENSYLHLSPLPQLRTNRIRKGAFADTIRTSKINLALDGIGAFTFRHLEIWALGGFLMSSPSIRDIEIPLGAKEGIHYVTYENTDDLIERIRYYLAHPHKREQIAQNGYELFRRMYSFEKHGAYIKQVLQNLRNTS